LDIGTIIGIIGGFGIVIIAMISGGRLAWFIDGPSLMIVLGGTAGMILINYRLGDILAVINIAKNSFLRKEIKVDEMIEIIVGMSRVARREGILALQDMAKQNGDPFFIKAVNLIVAGIEPQDISDLLETELSLINERYRLGADIFISMGSFAPVMGMLGTLIGIVQMLMKMNETHLIAPSLAIALIATFYGVILSKLIFHPIAGKMKTKNAEESLVKKIIIRGVLSIQAGENPRMIEQKLHSFAAPKQRGSLFSNA
jgi:chemotaxis protein MotA